MEASLGRAATIILGFAIAFSAMNPIRALAEDAPTVSASGGACSNDGGPLVDPLSLPHWNGWGVDNAEHRFQPAEMAQLAVEDLPKLKLKWAFGFPGVARVVAQPTIIGGRLLIGSQSGKVYALDANSGCAYWQFDAGKPVRSAIVAGAREGGWAAYFGAIGASVYAVDVVTGKELWQVKIDDHRAAMITGAPTLVGTTLFVPVSSYEEATGANPAYNCCSFRGSVVALEAATGKILWKAFTITQPANPTVKNEAGVQLMGPSGAAVWSAPTFDASTNELYVTTGDNYSDPPTETSDAILAFNVDSGELAWSRQMTSGDAYNIACDGKTQTNCPRSHGPDYDFGSSAVLVDLGGGKRALIGAQKSGVVTALDPDRAGEIIWQKKVGRGGSLGGIEWGVAADRSNVYVALSDIKLSVVPVGVPGAQPSTFNPKIAFLYDNKVGGGLLALKLDTGEEIWRTPHPGCADVPGCSPGQPAAVTAIPGVVFSGGLDGRLRAYSTGDGRIIWDMDTKGNYHAVNGVETKGGSIDGGGPVVVGGTLYVTSGSGQFGAIPGNALLAYSVDGR